MFCLLTLISFCSLFIFFVYKLHFEIGVFMCGALCITLEWDAQDSCVKYRPNISVQCIIVWRSPPFHDLFWHKPLAIRIFFFFWQGAHLLLGWYSFKS